MIYHKSNNDFDATLALKKLKKDIRTSSRTLSIPMYSLCLLVCK